MQLCDIHHEWMISDRPAQHSTVAVGQVRSLNCDDIMGKKISKLSTCNLTKHMTPNSSCDTQTWCPRIKMSTNLHVAFITVFDWAKLLCPTNMSFRICSSQAIRWPILKKGNLMQQEQTFIQTQIHNNTLGMFWVGRGTGGIKEVAAVPVYSRRQSKVLPPLVRHMIRSVDVAATKCRTTSRLPGCMP